MNFNKQLYLPLVCNHDPPYILHASQLVARLNPFFTRSERLGRQRLKQAPQFRVRNERKIAKIGQNDDFPAKPRFPRFPARFPDVTDQDFRFGFGAGRARVPSMMSLVWPYLNEIGLLLFLVGANAFFVATEFAFVKIRASQLRSMRRPGTKNHRLNFAIRVTTHLDRYLSATQLGITLTSLGLGWAGEPVIAHWLEKPLGHFGIFSHTTIATISYIIAFASITFFHITLGELLPKYFAIQRPRVVVLWMGAPLIGFYYLCYPFIWLLNRTANRLLRWVGIQSTNEFDHGFNQEELQYVLMNSRHVHPSDELVNKLMLKALRLKETTAEQVMIPRDRVTALWRDRPLRQNISAAQKSGYSRLPLCGSSMNEVLGVIHVKELLWQVHALGEDQTDLMTLVRPVLTFMDKTRLPSMLELFRKSRNHLAVVIDSDELMLGLVSFEDVLEELVGDIRDEFDIEKGPIYERTEMSVLVDSDLPLRDLASEMNWPLPTDTTDTVEKWALRHFGHVPLANERKEMRGFLVIATEVSSWRIRRLRIERLPVTQNEEGEEGQEVTARTEEAK